jgi:hypothetical protein
VVYVPGDNELTDCQRSNNGGYNDLERLAYMRTTMLALPGSFGQQHMTLEHQGPLGGVYSENTRWTDAKVVFVGLNIPGSNNNKVNSDAECVKKSARSLQDCADDNIEYAARDAANIAFIKESFQKAKLEQAAGVMAVIQADSNFDLTETEDFSECTQPGCDGFDLFPAVLVQEAGNYNGQVVLVHGDAHFFKLDKPLIDLGNLMENFTRLETFGSSDVHWIKAMVDADSRNEFGFTPMIVPGN